MWRDLAYLHDIATSCERILAKTRNQTLEQFLESDDVHDIVVLHFAVIGEAARKLSDETKERLAEVPWPKVVGMRNRIVHDYKRIDYEEVWKVVSTDIPELHRSVRRELGPA
ncbi:DUF86 domain-containing protein [bacterium]|nr:DUF86 domain-containing protein [bacterium]